jgi:hypothetical protein
MEVDFRVTCLQCLGSGMFITDTNFSDPDSGSKIIRILDPDPINPKNCFYALGNMIRDVHPGYGS